MQQEYTNDFAFAAPYITSGESILWRGKPDKGNLLTHQDIFLIPFSIVWCGFAIFWELCVIQTGFTPFILFGIPFVCVGLYLVVGRFFWTAWIRKRTAYVITNRKIIRARGNRIDMIESRNMPPVRLEAYRNGNGTITIGYPNAYYRRNNLRSSPDPDFVLENVPNVARVQQIIAGMER